MWYEKSYAVFNKSYEKDKRDSFKKKDNKNNILKKFKSLLD